LIQEKFPNTEILIGYIGAVIGTHAGNGTIALFHVGKHR
jgi:fatty acid-binding protein DegV